MTGLYTDIVEIVAPSSAVAGSIVDIQVKIENKHTSTIGIMVDGALDYGVTPWPDINFPYDWDNVAAGATKTFYGSFTMPYYPPGEEIIIHAYSYWYSPETYSWYLDDEKTKVITVAAPLKGTINKKELEYDESRASIPAYDVLQGKSGRIHLWGRNDTTSYQTIGMSWIVTDPDYQVVERHEDDWAFGWVGAGQDREFISYSRFSLNKAGTYRIAVVLYMNSAAPVEVDSYEGVLCAVIPLKGTISKKELEYNEHQLSIPLDNLVLIGRRGLVHVWGRNDTSDAQQMGIGWTVTDPDGLIVEEYGTWEAWPYSPPGEAHPFTGGRFDFNKAGVWMIAIELRMNKPSPVVVDTYSGPLCAVSALLANIFDRLDIKFPLRIK